MSQLIVISAIGSDHTGVVQGLTKAVLDCGGNIEESRMTTLGSEFAMLLLVSGNWHLRSKLDSELEKLGKAEDLQITVKETDAKPAAVDRMPYLVDVLALDHEGIVFNLADFFAARNIEIADVATHSYAAAHTGAPMFSVQMSVNVPSDVHIAQLRDEFHDLCETLNLDAVFDAAKP